MKTYDVEIDGKQQEVIPVGMAFSYALFEDLQALCDDEEITEDDFISFIDEKSIELEEKLKELWNDWKEDRD